MDREDGVVLGRKAEIDTSAPFRSVKEAISLFGEKVLAGELYATKLKQIQSGGDEKGLEGLRRGNVETELEETRQNLQNAREESMSMAHCLSSLQEELERTKQELKQLKQRETEKNPVDPEIEDVEFFDNLTKFEIKSPSSDNEEKLKFQKKRYVTFANAPSVAHVTIPRGVEKLQRHRNTSFSKNEEEKKKKKKRPLIPLNGFGGIFSRKKGNP